MRSVPKCYKEGNLVEIVERESVVSQSINWLVSQITAGVRFLCAVPVRSW
jgi:hypothetical protein